MQEVPETQEDHAPSAIHRRNHPVHQRGGDYRLPNWILLHQQWCQQCRHRDHRSILYTNWLRYRHHIPGACKDRVWRTSNPQSREGPPHGLHWQSIQYQRYPNWDWSRLRWKRHGSCHRPSRQNSWDLFHPQSELQCQTLVTGNQTCCLLHVRKYFKEYR